MELAGDRIAIEPEPDSAGIHHDYHATSVHTGRVSYVERGGVERTVNVGTRPFHQIVVELKDAP